MIKNSIVKRWAMSVLLGIIVLIIIIGVAVGVVLKRQYYNSVEMTLNSRATSMVVSTFTTSGPVTDETFNQVARNFVNNFSDKNLMEVWVIDKYGDVVVSSTGFSVRETLIVSPIPSASSEPIPIADFTSPDVYVPASVTPR